MKKYYAGIAAAIFDIIALQFVAFAPVICIMAFKSGKGFVVCMTNVIILFFEMR